jgi:hypothetical protein
LSASQVEARRRFRRLEVDMRSFAQDALRHIVAVAGLLAVAAAQPVSAQQRPSYEMPNPSYELPCGTSYALGCPDAVPPIMRDAGPSEGLDRWGGAPEEDARTPPAAVSSDAR